MEILIAMAIVFNFALVFFTGHYLINTTWHYRWVIFAMAGKFDFAY
jgi:hypothetical protein